MFPQLSLRHEDSTPLCIEQVLFQPIPPYCPFSYKLNQLLVRCVFPCNLTKSTQHVRLHPNNSKNSSNYLASAECTRNLIVAPRFVLPYEIIFGQEFLPPSLSLRQFFLRPEKCVSNVVGLDNKFRPQQIYSPYAKAVNYCRHLLLMCCNPILDSPGFS